MKIWSIACFFVVLLTGVSLGLRYWTAGELDSAHTLLSFFLVVNVLICYCEICLLLRVDTLEDRRQYWESQQATTDAVPAIRFLTTSVPLRQIASPRVWSELWAVYSLYDASYCDRKTYGFNVDIANGVVTPILSLVLLGTFTVPFLPARVTGILGVLLFWQWIYVTSVYMVSFFMARRHQLINRKEILIYIWVPNLFWILVPIFGFYISVQLVLEGSYVALGLH